MIEILTKTNFSIEDAGFACIRDDRAIISHTGEKLEDIKPRAYRWSNVLQHFPYYRLYLITEGSMRIHLNSGELIMTEGNMYLVPPLSIKSGEPAAFTKHYYTHFNIKSLPFNFLETYQIKNAVAWDEQDRNLNGTLLENFKTDTLEAKLKVQGCFALLLSKFFRGAIAPAPETQRFYPVLNYIEKNIDQNICIEQLAELMHISKIYFATLFSQTFKISPIKFILEKRMLLAQELLITSTMSIKEIADRLGYKNEYYFSTTFKRSFGISPTKWRTIYTGNDAGEP